VSIPAAVLVQHDAEYQQELCSVHVGDLMHKKIRELSGRCIEGKAESFCLLGSW